ncbi:hypothetical protein [Novipirellula galeiformis]|uniref:hypothetical protein n=1 Tax=Novipirellula galeiformis TaxID=2528004 RepID=UPI001E51921D|nr:hypothetical protein [Novipirellula galeiformis]
MSQWQSYCEETWVYGAFDFPESFPSFAKITAKPQNPLAPEKIKLQPMNTIPHAKASSKIKAASENTRTNVPLAIVARRAKEIMGKMRVAWTRVLRQLAAADPNGMTFGCAGSTREPKKRTSHGTRLSIVL